MFLGANNSLSPTVIRIKNEKGEDCVVTNPGELAELFNKFLKKKVEILRHKTNVPPTVPPVSRLREWLSTRGNPPPAFKLREITPDEFRRILKKINLKRTHGVDTIDAGSLIEEGLIHLVNLSIRESCFSQKWKPQLIFPHFKKNRKDILENYRPVSHLVQVGLIAEYAVYFQIVEHFVKYDLFHPNHHGSIANHSTATAIIQLFDLWTEAAERQELSAICLLDQSAAYDLLDHQILGEKLKLYNFSW